MEVSWDCFNENSGRILGLLKIFQGNIRGFPRHLKEFQMVLGGFSALQCWRKSEKLVGAFQEIAKAFMGISLRRFHEFSKGLRRSQRVLQSVRKDFWNVLQRLNVFRGLVWRGFSGVFFWRFHGKGNKERKANQPTFRCWWKTHSPKNTGTGFISLPCKHQKHPWNANPPEVPPNFTPISLLHGQHLLSFFNHSPLIYGKDRISSLFPTNRNEQLQYPCFLCDFFLIFSSSCSWWVLNSHFHFNIHFTLSYPSKPRTVCMFLLAQ